MGKRKKKPSKRSGKKKKKNQRNRNHPKTERGQAAKRKKQNNQKRNKKYERIPGEKVRRVEKEKGANELWYLNNCYKYYRYYDLAGGIRKDSYVCRYAYDNKTVGNCQLRILCWADPDPPKKKKDEKEMDEGLTAQEKENKKNNAGFLFEKKKKECTCRKVLKRVVFGNEPPPPGYFRTGFKRKRVECIQITPPTQEKTEDEFYHTITKKRKLDHVYTNTISAPSSPKYRRSLRRFDAGDTTEMFVNNDPSNFGVQNELERSDEDYELTEFALDFDVLLENNGSQGGSSDDFGVSNPRKDDEKELLDFFQSIISEEV